MTTLRDAAQQALEALNLYAEQYPHMVKGYTVDAENALRAALAEFDPATQSAGLPQTCAKPAAYVMTGNGGSRRFIPLYAHPPRGCSECGAGSDDTADGMTALYCVKCGERANPREWQGLTDEEISDLVREASQGSATRRDGSTPIRVARPDPITFGRYIADARKKQMSQKELASQILREEDDEPISPQYLNDIERGRRNPSSDHLIQQFAKVLKIDADYLSYLAGKLPEEIRRKNLSEDAVKAAFLAFRKPQIEVRHEYDE